jgi:hypothetical protein
MDVSSCLTNSCFTSQIIAILRNHRVYFHVHKKSLVPIMSIESIQFKGLVYHFVKVHFLLPTSQFGGPLLFIVSNLEMLHVIVSRDLLNKDCC